MIGRKGAVVYRVGQLPCPIDHRVRNVKTSIIEDKTAINKILCECTIAATIIIN